MKLSAIPLLGAPTASGKSSLALDLARELPIEVVTADAMQVYKGLDIGTAKPTPQERARVAHHLLDLVTPDEPFSVAQWVQAAQEAVSAVLGRGRIPLVVGGTGFYLRALQVGLPTVPAADPALQEPIWREFEEGGAEPLEDELAAASPEDVARAQRNPRRLVRALEILRRTGRPPRDFPFTEPPFATSLAVLLPTMEELQPRIEERAARMFEEGLVAEVRSLRRSYPNWATATQAIGYKEVALALDGEIDMTEAQQRVVQATRSYAKRQLTWFGRQEAQLRRHSLAAPARQAIEEWLLSLPE